MAKGDPVHGAHSDDTNQVFTQIGVIGTLGTADTKGTALTLPIAVDPDTGAQFVKPVGYGPTSIGAANPSFVLQYDANSNLATVNETLNGTAYVKTLQYDANNNLATVSAWS